MTTYPMQQTKPIYCSKTFWLQVVALASLAAPQVGAWVEANPVSYTAALAALNVLMRFFTSGRVSVCPPGEKGDGGGVKPRHTLPVCGMLTAAAGCLSGVMGLSLTGCSASAPQVPVKACYIDRHGNSICYSSAEGVSATVDRRGSK